MPIVGTKKYVHQRAAFLVEIPGVESAAFQRCTPLVLTADGPLPITLSRGVTSDAGADDLRAWTQASFACNGNPLGGPRQVKIHQINRAREIVQTYVLLDALPIRYEISGWDGSSSGFVMESITLAYSDLRVIRPEPTPD